MIQKSYDDSPSLYLIPSPIGNLDDITLRSIKIIEFVDVIFAEDTRVAKQLLNHLKIKKNIISSNEHNEYNNREKILSLLKEGKSIGLMSDRGTPTISDPGYEVVKYVADNGYNVICLPGATALIPALAVSGIKTQPFLFYGFLSSKESERKKQLLTLQDERNTIIFYESPHRIQKTLDELLSVFGDRKISISREISKKFEEVTRGSLEEIVNLKKEYKGEIVLVVEGNKEETSIGSIYENVNIYIKEGYSVMESIKKTAKERQIPKSVVYTEYHKNSKEKL
jgi:16S rRNA (cytidine1402-2'-O)-methyltransferase